MKPLESQRRIGDAELLDAAFQGKWRKFILIRLLDQPSRLSELRRSIPSASKKMLVDSLHVLEEKAIIERVDLSTPQMKHVEYRIADDYRDVLERILARIRTPANGL